jgi:hypothetical protein
VLDERSKLCSEPVDIVEGQLLARTTLDLDAVEWVSGRIEAPEGTQLNQARVLTSTAAKSAKQVWQPGMQPPDGMYVAADGSFRVQVERGARTRLVAWHAWLAPADPGGAVEVDGGRDGVLLKLVEGDQLRLAVPQLAALRRFTAARVGVYTDKVEGQPQVWLHAPLVDGALRFTGVPRGRATLWIDAARGFAPLVLADIEVAAGLTELGSAEFSKGSTLRVHLKVKEGQAAPRIYVSAKRAAEPALFRDHNSNGELDVLLSGLEAGKYTVTLSSIMANTRGSEQQIEFDGKSDVDIDMDLR